MLSIPRLKGDYSALFSTLLFFLFILSSGIPIPSSLAEINFNYNETVDPKCNTVCFMKSEGNLHRNTISTNSKYICYAVKGSLVRVIHASTGDKLLLRGHESPICDMKFSTADLDLLCTIDEGNTGSNIFVWKLSKENEFTNTLVCSLPFTASCVHSHPLSPCLWTFSHESVVCLFSTSQPPSSGSRLAYDDFPVHHTFAGAVIGQFPPSPRSPYHSVQTTHFLWMDVFWLWPRIPISLLQQSLCSPLVPMDLTRSPSFTLLLSLLLLIPFPHPLHSWNREKGNFNLTVWFISPPLSLVSPSSQAIPQWTRGICSL
jgi:hypothetical protein